MSFLQTWENVPLHEQLSCYLALACFLLCVLVYTLGAIVPKNNRLPVVPLLGSSRFPLPGDAVLTLVVALVFVAPLPLTISARQASQGTSIPDLSIGLLTTVFLYAPMLARYCLLPSSDVPKPKIWQVAALPIFYAGIIFLVSFLIEASGLTTLITEETGSPEVQDIVAQFQEGNRYVRLLIAGSAVVVAPIAEEVCFRGFLYNILRQKSGKYAAAAASALFFASIHTSLPQFLPLFVFGVIQCIAYEKARSLWLPISIHLLFNATSVLSILVMMRG